jgi:phenylalanyl-tRNA synthetase beta chain
VPGLVDAYPAPKAQPRLKFSIARLAAFVGADIPAADAAAILERLGCAVKQKSQLETTPGSAKPGQNHPLEKGESKTADTILLVTPPSYRPDLERPVDLAEEVLRIWGMHKVEATLPGGRGRIGRISPDEEVKTIVGRALRAEGLSETLTYAFARPDDLANLRMPLPEGVIDLEVLNPIVAGESVLRQSLVPNLLKSITYNQNHGVDRVALYEIGRVFQVRPGKKLPKERPLCAGVLCGQATEVVWRHPARTFSFFDAKAACESVLDSLGIERPIFAPQAAEEAPWLQPGQAASISKQGGPVFGWVGQVHPLAARAFGCEGAVYAFELDLAALQKARRDLRAVRDIPDYPAVNLDLAVVVDEDVHYSQLAQTIYNSGGKLLRELHLFDVYADPQKLGERKKSLAFNLAFGASDHTLTAEDAEAALARIVKQLQKQFQAELRA